MTMPRRTSRQDSTGEEVLNFGRARSMLDLLAWGDASGLNTYALPMDGPAGPRVSIAGVSYLQMSSCDYLGFAAHPAVCRAAVNAVARFGAGTGGVRLLTGTNTLHRDLERRIADTLGTEDAMVTGSGFLANLAAVPHLTSRGDLILYDELAHRSLVDACRLSQAEMRRFSHSDLAELEGALAKAGARRVLVIVDGVYSMDGDVAPLAELLQVIRRHGALLLADEAHALGVLGPRGTGSAAHAGIDPFSVNVWTGSLSKAVGSHGGYVAGSAQLIRFLRHEAAPYIFSAALAPASAGAALASLELLAKEPDRLGRLHRNAKALRTGLRKLGRLVPDHPSAIVPLLVGDERETWSVARRLMEHGVVASAVAWPAVPRGKARLRLCAMATHASADIAAGVDAIARSLEGTGHAS